MRQPFRFFFCGGQVHPPGHRQLLELVQRRQRCRNLGQAIGNFPGRLLTPQAHQPRELFTIGFELRFSLGNFQQGLCIKCLLQALLAFAQVAGVVLPLGDFRRGFRRHDRLARENQRFGVSDHPVILFLNIAGQIGHAFRYLQGGAIGSCATDLPAGGERENPEEVLHDIDIEFSPGVLEQRANAEHRVLQQPGLHQVRLGHPQILQCGLQPSVVE